MKQSSILKEVLKKIETHAASIVITDENVILPGESCDAYCKRMQASRAAKRIKK